MNVDDLLGKSHGVTVTLSPVPCSSLTILDKGTGAQGIRPLFMIVAWVPHFYYGHMWQWWWQPRSSSWTFWLSFVPHFLAALTFFLNLIALIRASIPQLAVATTTCSCLTLDMLSQFILTLQWLTPAWQCAVRPHCLALWNVLELLSPYFIYDDFLTSKKGKGPQWFTEGTYGIHSAQRKYGTGEKVTVTPFAFGM